MRPFVDFGLGLQHRFRCWRRIRLRFYGQHHGFVAAGARVVFLLRRRDENLRHVSGRVVEFERLFLSCRLGLFETQFDFWCRRFHDFRLRLGLGVELRLGCWFRFRYGFWNWLWFGLDRDASAECGVRRWLRRLCLENAARGAVRGSALRISFTQRNQRVEHVGATSAAHVSLPGAQIHGRDDQGQRAFWADGEQAVTPCDCRRAPSSRRASQKSRYQTTVRARVSPRRPAPRAAPRARSCRRVRSRRQSAARARTTGRTGC